MLGDKLGVGMIGAGSMAVHHLEAWQRCDGATVTAITNRTLVSAEALASRFGIPRVCRSAEELVRRPDVDVVSIATPHHLHHALSLAAISEGKHVAVDVARWLVGEIQHDSNLTSTSANAESNRVPPFQSSFLVYNYGIRGTEAGPSRCPLGQGGIG
jgi:pyrroline-5-carboxylate reductase